MLYLVSLGLCNKKGMSLEAFEVLKCAHKVYVETYTSNINDWYEELKSINKSTEELTRERLENNMEKFIEEARNKDIAICAPGDVLSATTHAYLMKLAHKNNVRFKVIHGVSIISAVAKTGLSIYRFGRVVSMPHPKNFNTYPESVFERINENMKMNLHTLLLLDIGMRCKDALEILESKIRIDDAFCCYMVGCNDEQILYGKIEKLKDATKKWDNKAQCIIIPANMEFYEEEIAEIWKI